jgi:hypothetical protein
MFKKIVLASALALLSHAQSALAGPDEYVYPARVTAGEREIDFKFGSRSMNTSSNNSTAGSIGLGYGVNEHWFTEVYFKYKQDAGSSGGFDAIEWENRFQLTETGKYPVDIGFLFEAERPEDRSEGYEFKFGPLLQADIGKTEWIANFLVEKKIRADTPEASTAYYRLQGRYRLSKEFSPGFQVFGDLGTWDNWASTREQGHRIGPAIFGKLPLDGHTAFKYNAAYLIGKTRIGESSYVGNSFRVQLEYEF